MKKNLLLLTLLILQVHSGAQTAMKKCVIKGRLGNSLAPYVTKVFLQARQLPMEGAVEIDSMIVTNGEFNFTRSFMEPNGAFLLLRLDKKKLQEE